MHKLARALLGSLVPELFLYRLRPPTRRDRKRAKLLLARKLLDSIVLSKELNVISLVHAHFGAVRFQIVYITYYRKIVVLETSAGKNDKVIAYMAASAI